jgi:hypothetical protein
MTPIGVIVVAGNRDLRRFIRVGLRAHGGMTAVQIANYSYWGRGPRSRLAVRWWANRSQQSSARRAIAALRRRGDVVVLRKVGRAYLYGLAVERG